MIPQSREASLPRIPPGSPMGAGRFAQAALFAFIGVEAVTLATSVATLLRWDSRNLELNSAEVFFADGWDFGLGLAYFGMVLICGIAWLIWQHQAHANLYRLQATRFRPAAVWLYLVPILSLYLPYQAVAELARAGVDRPALRRWWWSLYLVTNVALGVGSLLAIRGDAFASTLARTAAAVLGIGAAISAIRVISLVNAGLESRRLRAGWASGPPALSRRAGTMFASAAGSLTLVGSAAFGFLLPELLRSLPETAATSNMSFAVGTCFNESADSFSAVSCHEPHQAEIYRIVDHPEASAYPGEQLIVRWAEPQCYARFESYTGVPYQDSALEFGYLYPSAQGWNAGDREIVCYLFDPSGDDLTAPIAPPA